MKNLTKNFVFDIIAAVLLLALGLCGIFLPEYGLKALQYIVAALLVLYIISVLFPEVRRARGRLQILVFVEMALVFLVAIGLVIDSFQVIDLGEACRIFGFVLWLRGVTDICRAYFAHGTESAKYYPFWRLMIFIAFVSFGAYLFARPIITDARLVFIFSLAFIVLALFFIYLMILALPKKSGEKKAKKSEKKKA